MALVFGKRLPGIPSKKIRRDLSANFLADLVGGAAGGYETTASVTFIDYNKQTTNYNFDILAATPAAALTALQGIVLPAFGVTAAGHLQGLQMLSYTMSIHQEIGDDDDGVTNPAPSYGHQREMFGVLAFPVDGEIVEHQFPNPTDLMLDPNDKRYLNLDPANVGSLPLRNYITLFTSATPTLQIRGKKPGAPQKGFMRHRESRVQTENTKIG